MSIIVVISMTFSSVSAIIDLILGCNKDVRTMGPPATYEDAILKSLIVSVAGRFQIPFAVQDKTPTGSSSNVSIVCQQKETEEVSSRRAAKEKTRNETGTVKVSRRCGQNLCVPCYSS